MEENRFFPPLVFKNEKLNDQLFEAGYVHIPFLSHDEVKELRELFFRYHVKNQVTGLYVTALRQSKPIMDAINVVNTKIFSRAIEQHLKNITCLGGTFIVKSPNPENILHPHQDWNIVDETKHRSFTIWTPLQNVDEENGAMYVLPGSQNWIRGYRHITIPSVYGKIYDLTWKHSKPVYMNAGDALIFDHALVHSSKPNYSDKPRICATHGFVSKGADMRIYLNNNGTIEEYGCYAEYYLDSIAQTGPHPFPKLRDVDFKPIQLNEKAFHKLAGLEMPRDYIKSNSENRSWWDKMKKILS